MALHSRSHDRAASRDGRLRSLDALRGLAIVVMLLAGNPFMREDLPVQLKHPEWHGLRFADLFFPLFLFVVGIAMTLSRRTGSRRLVLKRVVVLTLLGVALSSLKHRELVLPGVLQHIAISYLLAWMVLQTPRRLQPVLSAGVLVGVWAGFLLWAGGGEDPWSMQDSFAHAVNGWLLGGFATEGVLQSVASSVTVLGGAFVGRAVRRHPDPRRLARRVAVHAAWLILVALLVSIEVPVNKKLWSPSFTLLTLGTSCAWFALLIWLIDIRRHRWWVTPLYELGANPIAVYVGFITVRALLSGYGDIVPRVAPFGSEVTGAMSYATGWVALGWLFAHLLHRRGVFLRL
ncbi:MAG: acyltransferase family protein, partial [Actinomycetota bacterium]